MRTQNQVRDWALQCLGEDKLMDRKERAFRVLEEALELVQACGVTPAEVNALRDYTFNRPVGEVPQELAGTMVCIFALATAYGLDAMEETRTEIDRVLTPEVLAKIRAKAKAAPDGPLPQTVGLHSHELAALKEYKNELVDMGRREIIAELRSVQDLIDTETSWAEALSARLKQMDLEA